MKLLIVEDENSIASVLKRGFIEDGYSVDLAFDGEEALYLIDIHSYDIIILDWMLPKKSGLEVLNILREQNITTPILMLTAKTDTKDKVKGLKNGADDYLTKPFSFEELEARVEALYRRVYLQNTTNHLYIGDITVDISKKNIIKDGINLELSLKEYELLMLLIKHKNSFVSKAQIEEQLWSNEEFISSNVIEVTIYNLRKKCGKDFIKSFRGLGYKIEI